MDMKDAIGWVASLLLFITVGSQVVKQIRSGSGEGVSRFLFLGQLGSSILFAAYSHLTGNLVFLVSNVFLVLAALVGQIALWRGKRRGKKSGSPQAAH